MCTSPKYGENFLFCLVAENGYGTGCLKVHVISSKTYNFIHLYTFDPKYFKVQQMWENCEIFLCGEKYDQQLLLLYLACFYVISE